MPFFPDLKNTTAKPKDWIKNLWELDTNETNNGLLNEDLIVWMRTAAFPNFRKLYRRIEQDLTEGKYTLKINYSKYNIQHIVPAPCLTALEYKPIPCWQ